MATSSEAVVYDTIVSIALIIDQREGEMWTDLIYHTQVYANQETFLSYSKPSAHFLNYSIFLPQVFSIFQMKNHKCTLFDNLSFFYII